jgi:D-glycero-D-manno-heptose 1,7-bisphosphate phosphatase
LHKAVFLDRDGIINIDKSYLFKREDFEFCDGIFEVLLHLQRLGYLLIIVTNQSGIARGYYTEEEFLSLTHWMVALLKQKGIVITEVFYCPHHPNAQCECRKPKAQMLLKALEKYTIDPKYSWMIGDKESDIEAGRNANIVNTIFVNHARCEKALYSVQSILDTIKIIKI